MVLSISSSSNNIFYSSDDYYYKSNHHSYDFGGNSVPVMEIVVTIVCVVGIAIVLALCCKCCCSNKYKGRVLQPPPDEVATPRPPAPAIYPQQQYNTVTVPTAVIPGHLNVSAYPTAGAPYPGVAPYPGGAPYAAPYPAVAPYPSAAPYPAAGGMPQPSAVPSAPDAQAFNAIAPPGWHQQALPPSYDQVMSCETAKHPPYNPYAPH